MTLEQFKEKAKQLPENLQRLYANYHEYSSKLRFDKYENPQGKNGHATKLFMKVYRACEEAGLDPTNTIATLSMASE